MESESSILWLLLLTALYALATLLRVAVVKYHNLHAALEKEDKLSLERTEFLTMRHNLVLSSLYLFKVLVALLIGWLAAQAWLSLAIREAYGHWSLAIGGLLLCAVLLALLGDFWMRSLAIQSSVKVLKKLFFPLRLIYAFLYPFAWFVLSVAQKLAKNGGNFRTETTLYDEEEILAMIEHQPQEEGQQDTEQTLIVNVLQFNEKVAGQIMVPRPKVAAVSIDSPLQQIIDKVNEEGYSRLPVYEETIDKIVGILYAKDLLSLAVKKGDSDASDLKRILRRPLFVPENMPLDRLLRTLQHHRVHMAIVVDKYGGTAGLLTLEDVLEEIVGDIQDEYDNEQPIVQPLGENHYLLDALTSLTDVNRYLPFDIPEGEEYDTVAGLLNYTLGKIPEIGDTAIIENFKFTVKEKEGNAITKVELEVLPEQAVYNID
jgi:CBS domain containing-hemolysin-like protein